MSSDAAANVQVRLLDLPSGTNSAPGVAADGTVVVRESRLYHLVHLPEPASATLELTFDVPGVRAYAFTFGS